MTYRSEECPCGHRDVMHEDLSLYELGGCYECDCNQFDPERPTTEKGNDAMMESIPSQLPEGIPQEANHGRHRVYTDPDNPQWHDK